MWHIPGTPGYTHIQQEEDEVLVSPRQKSDHINQHGPPHSKRITLSTFTCGVLSGVILLLSFQQLCLPSTNSLLQRTNTWTPILDRQSLKFYDTFVNGSIFNDPYSIYRAPPSPEVDAAWSTISAVRPFPISSAEVSRLGKYPHQTVRIPESWGYGPDMHFAELDSQHLLHCLNTVRKYAHHDYYFAEYSNSTETLPRKLAVHRDHCLGMLLQELTCRPSMNVLTFDWMEKQKNPFPDFSIKRKCVDHGNILEWQKNEEVKGWEENAKTLMPPEGAKQIPTLKGLLEIGEEFVHTT